MDMNRYSNRNLPDIWGMGQLLAFSGIDGFTDFDAPFVLHTGDRPGSFIVRLPIEARIEFQNLAGLEFKMILGDAVLAESPAGVFAGAFRDHHSLIGTKPLTAQMVADTQMISDQPGIIGETDKLILAGLAKDTRWVLMVVGKEEKGKIKRLLEAALKEDLEKTLAARSEYVLKAAVPKDLDAGRKRLLYKAVSVMKMNTEAASGKFGRRWTTPDRWPHRKMWLWDTAFHGIGFAAVDPVIGKDIVLAMLEQVGPDGMLPHCVAPDGERSNITQPPVLAWSVWSIFQKTEDKKWAGECLPLLVRYLEWIRQNRDQNNNSLPEWFIEGSPLCRSGESGMDNSSRFDKAVLMDAVDFAGFLCHDYQSLALLADRLEKKDIASMASQHADRIAAAVNNLLWSDKEGLYFDRMFDGTLSNIKASSGFVPLLAGIPDVLRAEALRKHLKNPATFAAPYPVPSISLDSGTYTKDMWRGPSWINYNFVIYRGLLKYGFKQDAECLKETSLAGIQKWYEKEGSLFEFYDSLDLTSPHLLDRKQRLSTHDFYMPISDYHWTAALTAAMLLE
jgi:hypothetical protein